MTQTIEFNPVEVKHLNLNICQTGMYTGVEVLLNGPFLEEYDGFRFDKHTIIQVVNESLPDVQTVVFMNIGGTHPLAFKRIVTMIDANDVTYGDWRVIPRVMPAPKSSQRESLLQAVKHLSVISDNLDKLINVIHDSLNTAGGSNAVGAWKCVECGHRYAGSDLKLNNGSCPKCNASHRNQVRVV